MISKTRFNKYCRANNIQVLKIHSLFETRNYVEVRGIFIIDKEQVDILKVSLDELSTAPILPESKV